MSFLSAEQAIQYHADGFVIAHNFLNDEETDLLRRTAQADRKLESESKGRADGEGGTVRLSLWNHPPDNIYGMVARSHRLVDSVEHLLEGEAYHYHSKIILKDAKVGGAWTWHQDYGYWYNNGVLFPLMTSVSIAIDAATKENGCMQVLKGSHKMGRVHHGPVGDQTGADMERVTEAQKRLETVYCEMAPGDALFFHCNVLHRSDQNRSNHARWSLICCYNAARNNPYKESGHPNYTKLHKVADSEISQIGRTHLA